MVLLPAPIVKTTRPTRETLRLCIRRSFLFCFSFSIVLLVFGAQFGVEYFDVMTMRSSPTKTSEYDTPRRGLIESAREKILGSSSGSDSRSSSGAKREDIMNEVEEVEYERPNDVSTETDFQEEQEEQEQEEEDIMEAKKDRDGEAEEVTGKGAEEVEGKLEEEREEEAPADDVKERDQEQEQSPREEEEVERQTATSDERRDEEMKEEPPREEDEQRKKLELERPRSFTEFTAKDLEDVERFDDMMRKRIRPENQCQVAKTYFRETLKPRYENLKANRIVIIDWSENYQNGIGDEMQHYQELFIIGISTGRAAYVKTQKVECDGLGVSEGDDIENSTTYEDLAKKCQFDLGDYFIGYGDVDWKWDKGKRKRATKELFDGGDFEETVFTWSQKGAYVGDAQPENYKGSFYAESDENSIVKTMEHPEFRAARVARIRIKTNFGHWCHPKPSDWGICLSYRWATNFEKSFTSSKCGEACGVGACFGTQMLTPRKHLKIAMLPAFEEMSRRGWKHIVGAHIRTGFADMSQVEPPMKIPRVVKEASLTSINELLTMERTKRKYPTPKCPIYKDEHRKNWPRSDEEDAGAAPMTLFLKCLADLMRDVRLKESDPLGLFFTTDSPAINAVLHSPEALEVLRVNGTEVLSTVGSFGNVKFSNTGICDDASSDTCVASDPRSAWLKSMVDMTLLGETDVIVILYSSKFADAALMRSVKVKRGRTHFYEDTRITHQLIDPLVSRIQSPNPSEEDWNTWGLLWDNFGPSGERENVKGSALARRTIVARYSKS